MKMKLPLLLLLSWLSFWPAVSTSANVNASEEDEICNAVLLPESTRPTDVAALMSIFEAMGKRGVMID